ncbi:MAG TPA: hypothetical protein VNT51_01395 [Miltoncostaeaceae bacterium]|nr:hypothetical protein [Miltoncostaeaceae bacterium]
MSTMLSEIVIGALRGPEVALARTRRPLDRLPGDSVSRPDVIVLGADVLPGSTVERVFTRWPLTTLVQIGGEGQRVTVVALTPTRVPLGALSPEDLLATVRRAARRSAGRPSGSPGPPDTPKEAEDA